MSVAIKLEPPADISDQQLRDWIDERPWIEVKEIGFPSWPYPVRTPYMIVEKQGVLMRFEGNTFRDITNRIDKFHRLEGEE